MQSEWKTILCLLYNDLNDHNRQEPIFASPGKLKQICEAHPCLKPYLAKLICETRDHKTGKGEKKYTYELLQQWAEMDQHQAVELATNIADNYGNWKDIKTLCLTIPQPNPLFTKRLICNFNQRLKKEFEHPTSTSTNVGKWAPREKTAPGIYDEYAMDWCMKTQPQLLQNINPKSLNKCRQEYRKVVSELHRRRPSNSPSPEPTEADIIRLATAAQTPEEEAKWNREWLVKMEKWQTINNLIPIAVFSPEDPPSLITLLRLLYRSSLKRCICITGKHHTWINAEKTNTTLTKIIRQILAPAAHTPAAPVAPVAAIHFLVKAIRETNIPPHSVEKLTLAIIANMDIGETKVILHSQILTCFFNYLGFVRFPHIVYLHTTKKRFFTTNPHMFQPLPVLAESPRATFFPNNIKGPTKQQWDYLVVLGNENKIRENTPFQAIQTLLDTRPIPIEQNISQNII